MSGTKLSACVKPTDTEVTEVVEVTEVTTFIPELSWSNGRNKHQGLSCCETS